MIKGLRRAAVFKHLVLRLRSDGAGAGSESRPGALLPLRARGRYDKD